jgi:hypothetical protein
MAREFSITIHITSTLSTEDVYAKFLTVALNTSEEAPDIEVEVVSLQCLYCGNDMTDDGDYCSPECAANADMENLGDGV